MMEKENKYLDKGGNIRLEAIITDSLRVAVVKYREGNYRGANDCLDTIVPLAGLDTDENVQTTTTKANNIVKAKNENIKSVGGSMKQAVWDRYKAIVQGLRNKGYCGFKKEGSEMRTTPIERIRSMERKNQEDKDGNQG